MTKVFILITLSVLSLLACKKDQSIKTFENITHQDIKELENKFTNQQIFMAQTPVEEGLRDGSIIFYKTNSGKLGKFKITSISVVPNNYLKMNIINYDAEGKQVLNREGIVINENFSCNLDLGEQTNNLPFDFVWATGPQNPNQIALTPEGAANFYLYFK